MKKKPGKARKNARRTTVKDLTARKAKTVKGGFRELQISKQVDKSTNVLF